MKNTDAKNDDTDCYRTYDLFSWLKMEKGELSPNPNDTPLGTLVPYYMTNVDPKDPDHTKAAEYWCYNDIAKFGDLQSLSIDAAGNDPFNLNTYKNIPVEYVKL